MQGTISILGECAASHLNQDQVTDGLFMSITTECIPEGPTTGPHESKGYTRQAYDP